jgi:hypothetical protein
MAVRTIVSREQFEITDDGITHTPTGYSLARSGAESIGQLGKRLPSGEYYSPDEVKETARRILLAHIRGKA